MIDIVNISKSYGEKKAIKEMSLHIKAGEIVGLLGLNGAGKSTAMNIITGYISPDSGYVTIGGHDVVKAPLEAKRLIGYLPEQFLFYNDMKVEEYLDFICDIKKVRKNRQKHISDLCERVGISHIRSRMIKNLSKGYRQRVGVVQALLGDPDVVILDEPTVGLDPSQIVDIRTLIKNVGEKRTVILSSHILSEVQMICSRVVMIHNGELIADGTPDSLRQSMSEPGRIVAQIEGSKKDVLKALGDKDIFSNVSSLGDKGGNIVEYLIEGKDGKDIRRKLFASLSKAGLAALSMNSGEFTLEDYFLKHVGDSHSNQKETK